MAQELRIFNNLTRQKEIFRPIVPNQVRFYSCGPTTYDFLHVGNARALVVGDLFHRVFKTMGYAVTFVRNFTDVDDKIIKAAHERGVDPLAHSALYVDECKKDMTSLGMLPATHTPKVSETMNEIIAMVDTLVKNGTAYVVSGEVFYHVPAFPEYGKLSKKKLEDLEMGHRVEVGDAKKHPADFVLWKPAKANEPAWDSPWGKGRPGWHIECSAMAKKFLGNEIDLHHGGIDLMFPHHENEIAQSEAANGCPFCRVWAHNEFLNFGTEKMSKSLGNVVTMRKFIETYGGQVLRQVLISAHYRTKMEWSDEVIDRAMQDVERIHEFALEVRHAKTRDEKGPDHFPTIDLMKDELANDFNSGGSLAHFFTFIRDVRRDLMKEKTLPANSVSAIHGVMQFATDALGVIHPNPEQVLSDINRARSVKTGGGAASEIEALLAERKEARQSKNFARGDEIRKILTEKGVVIKDNPDGTTTWKYS